MADGESSSTSTLKLGGLLLLSLAAAGFLWNQEVKLEDKTITLQGQIASQKADMAHLQEDLNRSKQELGSVREDLRGKVQGFLEIDAQRAVDKAFSSRLGSMNDALRFIIVPSHREAQDNTVIMGECPAPWKRIGITGILMSADGPKDTFAAGTDYDKNMHWVHPLLCERSDASSQ